MPTEGGMIFKRLMKVTDDYYVKRTSVTAKGLHVILDVELYPFEPEPVVRIIEKMEENQYITAFELGRLGKAGMRRTYDREKFLKRLLWPKTREKDPRTPLQDETAPAIPAVDNGSMMIIASSFVC